MFTIIWMILSAIGKYYFAAAVPSAVWCFAHDQVRGDITRKHWHANEHKFQLTIAYLACSWIYVIFDKVYHRWPKPWKVDIRMILTFAKQVVFLIVFAIVALVAFVVCLAGSPIGIVYTFIEHRRLRIRGFAEITFCIFFWELIVLIDWFT